MGDCTTRKKPTYNPPTWLEQWHKDHPPNPLCDHDKDKAATGGGTWTIETEGKRRKVVCSVCQKFYGMMESAK